MKKHYLFFTLFIAIGVISLDAQITLTSSANTPSVGNSFNYHITNPATFNVMQSGANQTWDFSTASTAPSPFNYINLASSIEPATYPSANLVESNGGSENYYNSTVNAFALEGQLVPGQIRAIFTDPREMLNFPITYPNSFNETFSGTAEIIAASITYNRGGTNVMTADGYGTLILPYTTVNNVLKITNVGNYTDMLGVTTIATYVDTLITFYNATTNNFIAGYSVLYANGTLTAQYSYHIDQADLVVGIDDVVTAKNYVTIYPNPAKNVVTIKSNQLLDEIHIYDLTGKMMKAIKPSSTLEQQIKIDDLNAGIYFVKYIDDYGSHSKKMIIE